MVVASPNSNEKGPCFQLPLVDFSLERSEISKQIVNASEEYGFFNVINHGVSEQTILEMEREALNFFGKTLSEKEKAGPANPFGYGCKSIGLNGDIGEVEYLLLHNNPLSILHKSKYISKDPAKFSCAVSGYMESVRELACEILDMMAEGLGLAETTVFSHLINHAQTDSLFRLNHYPSLPTQNDPPYIGFGDHTDPQILTLLRSNDVAGLQISFDARWVPVLPDPTCFCVNVGDILQVMTNGRFKSVRHRVVTNSKRSRLSMAYFAAPPLHTEITALPQMIDPHGSRLYSLFTWAEYKKAVYELRLGDARLNLFKISS